MEYQPGLHITFRESQLLKLIGFTWLALDANARNQELLQGRGKKADSFTRTRLLLGRLLILSSVYFATRTAWRLMS
jgi:hypothetical protein